MARYHTTKPADRCARQQFSVDSQLQAQASGETHVALFRPSWKRKPFLILFPNLVAKNVHLVAMMRLVFGFQAQSCDCTKFSGRKTSRSSRKMRLCARIFRALNAYETFWIFSSIQSASWHCDACACFDRYVGPKQHFSNCFCL